MGLIRMFKDRWNKPDSCKEGDGKFNKSMRLEESLQGTQGRYRKLLNHTQAIQYTHDLQGQFLSVDQEITEFLGYDRNSLLKMNIRALLASEVRHRFEAYLAEIKRQGVAKGLMVLQTAAGENRILKYYNTLRTEDVATPFVQGIAYDVTEQKQTKKALAQLSEQLSIVLKSLPVVCYISKAEEDYGATYITHNVKAITGFDQTDFTSKSSFWANRVHPEDAPKIFADLPQIFEKGYHEHQYRWQVADGSYKWFYDYTRLIKPSDGKNYIIGMMQDITERKRAEEALLHAAQQWRTTFDGINDFVSLLDLDGKILRCNKAMKDFVGKPFNEIINHSCWEVMLGATTVIEDCPFLRMKETLHRETTIMSVNGLWFNVSIDPVFDQAGRLIGAVNIITDVTKRKQAEEAVAKLSQENAIIAEIGRIVSSTLNIDEVYERFSREVHRLIPFDRIEIITTNPQDYTITIAHITGIEVRGRNAGDTIPMLGTAVQEVFRTRTSQLIQPHNIEELARRFPPLLSSFQAGLRSMIFVPLISEDQVIGVLSLKTTKPDFYTERDLRLTERVGNQIAGAIANSQLFIERKHAEESAARLAQENAVMAEIGRIVSSTLDIDEVYERFAEEVRQLIPFDRIVINTIDIEKATVTNVYMAGAGISDRKVEEVYPLKGSGSAEMVRTKTSLLIQTEDFTEYKDRFPMLLSTFQAGFRSIMNIPLFSKGRIIGGLLLRSLKPYAYTDEDVRLAERVGDQIAGAIANAQLFAERKHAEEAAKRLSHENAVMAEIGRIVSSTLNIEEVYERFAEEVRKLISFDRIMINIVNPGNNTTSFAYAAGNDVPDRRVGDITPLKGTATFECMRTRSNLLIQPEDIDKCLAQFPALLPTFQAGLRSLIFVPLISKDQFIGVLSLRSLKPQAYADQDMRLAERVGNQIIGAIANVQLYAEREQMEEALRKSEERFRDLYDHAPLGYHEYDAEGRLTNVNRTDLDMLGYTAEEMIGQQIWKFSVEGDTLREEVLAKLAGTSPPGRNLERIYRKKDGTTIPVLIEDRLILDEKGQIKGIRCTIQDITARKQAEEEKESLTEQLRQSQKMEAIGKLAGGVAHDFNNLLTVIHGYGELLLNSLSQENRLKQDVQEIINASERASSLTRQLLAFSRKQVLQPKVLDLNAHVSNMDKMLRRMIGEDVELVTLLTKDLGRIKADPGQIEQAILNLAINAKDAMLSGGKLTIETANVKLDEDYARSRIGVSPGDYVMLSVSDTGVGIAPETKERIFEPFFTTKEKGKGTGLGLSTVYGIVQQSGGNILVYSEPGLGTTFKIYLPRIEEGTESVRPAAISTKCLQGSETILLVEDEGMVRKLACTVLEKNGYTVLEASNGDEALDVVQGRNGNPIHLVVTDVVMPGMSGRQLADRLVSLRPEIKILYMSGYTDDAIVHHGVLDPGIAYIQKPFTPDALASKVRDILDGN